MLGIRPHWGAFEGGKMKKIYALLLCILFSFIIISCASVPSTSRDRVLSISGYSISETDFGGVERWYAVDKYNYDSFLDLRWDWGSNGYGTSYKYSFVIEPDGTGLYYDFSASKDGTAKPRGIYKVRKF